MSKGKNGAKLDTRENKILEEIEAANEGFTVEPIEKYLQGGKLVRGRSNQSRSNLVIVAALAVSLLLVVAIVATPEPTAEEPVELMQETVATVPTPLEETLLTTVPPPFVPEVADETVRVPIGTGSAEAVGVEPEPVAIEVTPEAVEVPVVVASVVDQTQVEMRPVEVPDGVTFNQFEAMEQTTSQPQAEQAAPQPNVEQSTAVAAPVASSSTYSGGFSQALVPSFSGVTSDYLPVETQFLSQSNGLVRAASMFIVSAALFDLYENHTASGEARYSVDVGRSSMHRETITLGLYVPRVADVRNVTSDKSGVDETWLRSQLISAACQDVGNIRTVMDQARNELAAEANGYELALNWYSREGQYVPRDASDEELINYCQLG